MIDKVNFYDYDGTLVATYTAEEFMKLSDMPTNPTHAGLVAEGWNWTLEEAKAFVALHGGLDIGQMYHTEDGKSNYPMPTKKDVELLNELSDGVEMFCKWFADKYSEIARRGIESAARAQGVAVTQLLPCLKSEIERDWELTKERREKLCQ